MSATIGVLSVLGVIGALLALHKLAQRRERKRMLARKAERDAYFEKQDRQRAERLEWHMQRTAESLRAQQDREKVTALEQQRLQQAGDVVDELANSIGGTLPSARHHPPRRDLYPTIGQINENQRRRNMEAYDQFSALGGSVTPTASDIDKFSGISWQPSESSAPMPAPSYTGSGGSFDGGGASGDYGSSSSSDSLISSSGSEP